MTDEQWSELLARKAGAKQAIEADEETQSAGNELEAPQAFQGVDTDDLRRQTYARMLRVGGE